jgi:tryptophan-rich sensory protein
MQLLIYQPSSSSPRLCGPTGAKLSLSVFTPFFSLFFFLLSHSNVLLYYHEHFDYLRLFFFHTTLSICQYVIYFIQQRLQKTAIILHIELDFHYMWFISKCVKSVTASKRLCFFFLNSVFDVYLKYT